jgi:glycosyltransferase involved in cell wall biosynthesis
MKIAMFGIKGVPVPAGAEYVVEQIGSRLVARGHEVLVYVRAHYTPLEQKEYLGMQLVHLPSIPTKNLDAITHSLLSSLAVLGQKADIVHIHSTGNSVFALHPRAFGIPTVVTSHGLDWQRAKWGLFVRTFLRMSDYTTTHFPTATTAVSLKMQRYYQEMYKRKVYYIPNGANEVEKLPPNEILELGLKGNDYLFFASRLVPEKGCHYLIEAYKHLDTDKKLVIAGDGVLGDKYAESLKKEATPNILFLGFVGGVLLQELLSNAYFYILPSEIEGLSAGLIEAMSYQNCVLVSDIEENLEVIEDCGVTFESRSVENLAEKIDYLTKFPDKVADFGEKAARLVKDKYDWEKITDQYEEIYRSLVK